MPSSPPGEKYFGFGVLDKQRVLSLPTIWFQIDTAIFRGHLDEMMPDVDCFDYSLPPINPDAGSVRFLRRRWCRSYFAGDFAKSARQFAKYHAYDGHDRENGIWKFLAQAKADGLDKARKEMLVYTKFDREPFPSLYEMFAGRRTTEEVFAEIETKKLTGNGPVMFFANYYCGLNEELLGHREKARELLAKAVASPWGRTAEGGPAYMWQCARLHAARLDAAGK